MTTEVEKEGGIQWQFNDYTFVLHSMMLTIEP